MAKLYFRVGADFDKVIKLREEIAKLKNELKGMDFTQSPDSFNSLNEKLGKYTKELDVHVSKAAEAGAKLEQKYRQAMNGISSDPLKSFDAELMKMCSNLNKYFDELLNKIESMSSVLQAGKIGIDTSSNKTSTQEIDELRTKNLELTDQLRTQKEEIKQQQEEWNKLATAIKTNNVSAIEQYKQATGSSSDTVKKAKSELKDLTKDLNENIKYYDKLAAQIASYKAILDRLYTAKEKGMTRVPIGDGATALITSEVERFKPQLDDVTQKSKEIAAQIYEQKKRQTELNNAIEQGNEKYSRTRTHIMDAREQLIQMRSAGLSNTAQYQQSAEELGKMRKQMVLVNAEMAYLSNPNKNLDTIKAGLTGIASSASLVVGVMGLVNQKNEDMVMIQTKIQSLLGIIVGLEGSYNMIKKTSILMIAIENAQRKASIASQLLESKAKTKNVALTWSEVAAQKALNIVASVNPYILLASSILTVVGGIYLLVKANKENASMQERVNTLMKEQKKHLDELKQKSDSLISIIKDEASTQFDKVRAYNMLQKIMPEVLKNMDLEKLKLLDMLSINKMYNEELNRRERIGAKVKVVQAEREYNMINNSLNTISQNGGQISIFDIQRKNEAKQKLDEAYAYLAELEKIQSEADRTEKKIETKNKDFWSNQKKEAEKNIESIASSQKRMMDAGNFTGINANTVKLYKDSLKKIKEAEKELKVYASSDTKQETQADKDAEKQLKQQEQLSEQLLSIRRKNQQDEINLREDGTEKRLAQIDLDYQKELDAIRRQEQEWTKINGGKLTGEQTSYISEWAFNASKKRESDIYSTNKAQAEATKKAWQEYFIEFGNYQEKRKNLIQKYDDEIAKLQADSPEYEIKVAEKNQAVENLDEQLGQSAKSMADLFEDARYKSVSSIQSIIDKYEMLVKYLAGTDKGDGTNVTMDELKAIGFTDKDIKKIENGEVKIKDVTDAIRTLKDELKEKSPWQSFVTDLDKGVKAIKTAGGDSKKIGQGIADIGSSITSFSPALSEFGSNIANIFGIDDSKITGAIEAVGGLGEMATGVGQIMSGDIVGGAMSAVSGISSVISALDGMFGADYSKYNKMKEEYDALNDIWDTLISKKQEYIDISYGDEARKVGQEALDLINKKFQSNISLGLERLNSGTSAGSHSIGVRQRKGMSKQGWDELLKASKDIGFDYKSVADGRMTGLFDLTAEQLSKLQDEAPTFWAKLDSDVQQYLQNIIDCNTELEDMKDRLNETMTGVSFDSFYDSFVSKLSDMSKSSKDMADDFGEYLKNAILSNLVANKYRAKIEALYNDWANKSDSDGDGIFDLTAEESTQLKEAKKALADEMIAERDAMASAFGWGTSSSQDSTKRGFGTEMTHEDAGELSGRFTALQVTGEEIKNQNATQVQSLNLLTVKVDAILAINSESKNIADDTRDLIANSYLELMQISENTGAIVKPIQQMQKDIAEVKNNTSKL